MRNNDAPTTNPPDLSLRRPIMLSRIAFIIEVAALVILALPTDPPDVDKSGIYGGFFFHLEVWGGFLIGGVAVISGYFRRQFPAGKLFLWLGGTFCLNAIVSLIQYHYPDSGNFTTVALMQGVAIGMIVAALLMWRGGVMRYLRPSEKEKSDE